MFALVVVGAVLALVTLAAGVVHGPRRRDTALLGGVSVDLGLLALALGFGGLTLELINGRQAVGAARAEVAEGIVAVAREEGLAIARLGIVAALAPSFVDSSRWARAMGGGFVAPCWARARWSCLAPACFSSPSPTRRRPP